MSRDQIQLTTEVTHNLKCQGRGCEQGPNAVHHRSHSHPEEPSTGIVSSPNAIWHGSHAPSELAL